MALSAHPAAASTRAAKAGRRLAHLKKAADSQRPVVTRGGTSSLVRAAPASLALAGTIKVRSARQERLTEAWSVGNRMVKNWLTGFPRWQGRSQVLVEDGQDQSTIEAIQRDCSLVAFVETRGRPC